jgi:hypothetical protein
LRLFFAALGGALVWFASVFGTGPGTVRLEIAIPLGIALATLAFVLAGSSSIRLGPHALVFQSFERTTVMLWSEVQSIEVEVEKSNWGTRTVIQTAEGRWRCSLLLNAPGFWPVMGARMQADVLRAAWFRSGSFDDPRPITRPWGPDPATFDALTLRPNGQQRVSPGALARSALSPLFGLLLSPAVRGEWLLVATFVVLCGLAVAWMSRRRVDLSPAGLEIHRFRTTVMPWSAVTSISRWTSAPGRVSIEARPGSHRLLPPHGVRPRRAPVPDRDPPSGDPLHPQPCVLSHARAHFFTQGSASDGIRTGFGWVRDVAFEQIELGRTPTSAKDRPPQPAKATGSTVDPSAPMPARRSAMIVMGRGGSNDERGFSREKRAPSRRGGGR